jgi:hypothetical protein
MRDIQNSGANVGYAFVNFIDVSGVIEFARAKLGKRWEMCQSDKVVQVRCFRVCVHHK